MTLEGSSFPGLHMLRFGPAVGRDFLFAVACKMPTAHNLRRRLTADYIAYVCSLCGKAGKTINH